MEEKVQNALLNSSGGNFDNFLHKIFSSSILYYITIPINILVDKIVKFPTTTVPKGCHNGKRRSAAGSAGLEISLHRREGRRYFYLRRSTTQVYGLTIVVVILLSFTQSQSQLTDI